MTITTSIIIEGPNGSGKSTLAKALAEKYMLPIVHATKPKDPFEAIDKAFWQYYYAKSSAVIFDRSHAISRLVYQHNTLGILEEELLEVMASHTGLVHNVIYCTGQGERDTDKPHYDEALIKETTDNQDAIRRRYSSIFDVLKHQRYNFEKDSISSLQLT